MSNQYFHDLLRDYYAQHLTKYELNQFKSAVDTPTSAFLDEIIAPMAFDPASNSYLAISDNTQTEGRPHYTARDCVNGDAEWLHQAYFTNALRIALPGDVDFNHPSDRLVMAPYFILTFEYDSKDMAFFQQQLGWFRSSKKPMDAPIGQFVRHLRSNYLDFVGLNVTYSGNKSFHYHFVFSTHVIAVRAPTATSMRHGFIQAWEALKNEMANFPALAIPANVSPDPALKIGEAYRRLPGGSRLTGSNHFFSMPKDTPVPQLTMWESITTRAGPLSATSLFDPAKFTLASVPKSAGKRNSTPVEFIPGSNEIAYCEEKMRAIFTDWPQFAGFTQERGEFRAMFLNAPSDKRPQSYMREDYRTVMIQGSNPYALTNGDYGVKMARLPRPLGEMITLWSTEYRQRLMAPGGRERTQVEQDFADQATDRVTAMNAVGKVLNRLVTENMAEPASHFVSAPEGISKSRSLIANTPNFLKLLDNHGLPPLIMFAFGNYDMAKEKAEEFDKAHPTARFGFTMKAIVLPSFSRLYKETCANLKVKEITLDVALSLNAKSVTEAIHDHQP